MSTVHTYRGITWTSNNELSKILGKSSGYVSERISKGITYEEIIDKHLNFNEYRGIQWRTDDELSRKLGKNRAYVNHAIKTGKTYEEIIDYVLSRNQIKNNKNIDGGDKNA